MLLVAIIIIFAFCIQSNTTENINELNSFLSSHYAAIPTRTYYHQ